MQMKKSSIEFHLESRSGIPPYLQLVQQVKQALRLGFLQPGDQIPTMREVVSQLAINPNTVFKAYRELEREGLVESRPGVGTFVIRSLTDSSIASHETLRRQLVQWLEEASQAGLNKESIQALFMDTLHQTKMEVKVK
jgi:GntR family transcriptional regulator